MSNTNYLNYFKKLINMMAYHNSNIKIYLIMTNDELELF